MFSQSIRYAFFRDMHLSGNADKEDRLYKHNGTLLYVKTMVHTSSSKVLPLK